MLGKFEFGQKLDTGNRCFAPIKILDEAGFAFGRSTLYDYKASVSEGGTPLSKEKATGRQRVLDEEEQMILCGFFFGATKKMCSN